MRCMAHHTAVVIALAATTACSVLFETGDGDLCDSTWSLTGNGSLDQSDRVTASVTDGCATYICGTYRGNFASLEPAIQFFGEDDVFVARLSNDGAVAWAHGLGSMGADHCNSIAVGNDTVVIGGSYVGDLATADGNVIQGEGVNSDGFVAGFELDGRFRFLKGLTSIDTDEVQVVAIEPDADGTILVGGFAADDAVFDEGAGMTNTGSLPLFLLRLAEDGSYVSSLPIADGFVDTDRQYISAIRFDTSFDPYRVIVAANAASIANAPCDVELVNGGGLLLSLSQALDCVWAQAFDANDDDYLDDVVVTNAGYFAVGRTGSPADTFMPLGFVPDVRVVDPGATVSAYWANVNRDGNPTSFHHYGGDTNTFFVRSAYRAGDGEVVILGGFNGNWMFNDDLLSAPDGPNAVLIAVDADDGGLRRHLEVAGPGLQLGTSLGTKGSTLVVAGTFDGGFTLGEPLADPSSGDIFIVATDAF